MSNMESSLRAFGMGPDEARQATIEARQLDKEADFLLNDLLLSYDVVSYDDLPEEAKDVYREKLVEVGWTIIPREKPSND